MNDYADHYSSIVQSILIGQTEQAHETVRCIPGGERGISKVPRNLPIPLQWQVFKRDHFVCRYCEKRTVLPPVLRLLSYFLGDDFRYHRHGLMTECHVAFWRDIASCDHIVPVARGGVSGAENLATACYMCNSVKQNWLLDELRWEINPIPPSATAWDGLAGAVGGMLRLAAIPMTPYYRNWLKAIENAQPQHADPS
jgi:5-methylcytosine-specific restriction endonuclease McrA